jgi:hypothetical protein
VVAVPVPKYLESADVDEVGYTLRTASLMAGPEDHFDEVDPSDYELFGIRYVILPSGSAPPVSADEVAVTAPYALCTTSNTGYIHVGTIAGTLTADRTDLGARSVRVLRSGLAESGDYLKIHFGGRQATLPPLRTLPSTAAGSRRRWPHRRWSPLMSQPGHTISFRYRGYSGYAVLFALTALTLAAFAGADAIRGRRGGPAAS